MFKRSEGVSRCTCGHVGDVTNNTVLKKTAESNQNQHGGFLGHGPCLVPGCSCEKFTWAAYLRGSN